MKNETRLREARKQVRIVMEKQDQPDDQLRQILDLLDAVLSE